MCDPDLYLERRDVERMPGFPPGPPFGVASLSPGINVIHGRNETGKSTVPRAISIVVLGASTSDARPRVHGRLRTSGGLYDVRVEAGQRSVHQDGESGTDLDLPAGAVGDRYRLWLQEFLQAEDSSGSFADQVLQETRGGHYIREAREDLGLLASPSFTVDCLVEKSQLLTDPKTLQGHLDVIKIWY